MFCHFVCFPFISFEALLAVINDLVCHLATSGHIANAPPIKMFFFFYILGVR